MDRMKNDKSNFRATPESKAKGAYLRGLRSEFNLTLRELANVSGYSDSHLYYLEVGRRNILPHVEAVYLKSLQIARKQKEQRKMEQAVARLELA
jgi:hypothetical protein